MRIVHISDFHLPKTPNQKLEGSSTYSNLNAALLKIKELNPQPELIVLGGDLLDEGKQGKYKAIKDLFSDFHIPIHSVLGNRDHLESYRKNPMQELPGDYKGYYSFDMGDNHFIMLHSPVAGRDSGNLDEKQLLWLSEDLRQHMKKSTLLFMHHPPVEIGVTWLDKTGLLNADSFWRIIPPHDQNIRGIFVSHIHIQMTCFYHGVIISSPPAVCFQYNAKKDSSKSDVSDEQPGFNLIDISEEKLNIRTIRFNPSE